MSQTVAIIAGVLAAAAGVGYLAANTKPARKTATKFQLGFYDAAGRRVRQPKNLFNVTLAQAKWEARNELAMMGEGHYVLVARVGGGKWEEAARVTSTRANPRRKRALR